MPDHTGYTPAPEEIAEMRSGVTHLDRKVDERHVDYNRRFDKVETAVADVRERVTRLSVTLTTLDKRNDAWSKAIIGAICATSIAGLAAHYLK